MTGIIILLILVFGVPYIWRFAKPYIIRWAQRRTENYFRRAMGMPPRDRQNSYSAATGGSSDRASTRRQYARRNHHPDSGPVIPKEYAEDVEFTEIRTFSDEHTILDGGDVSYNRESQVSDAEIIEIRKDS